MWLTNSSVGRKVIMSLTGLCLILFLTFHALMNVVAIFSPEGYNMVCGFLGANWWALVATVGLAALAVIHIIYAFVLTIQNKRARGNNAYEVTSRPKSVEWASKNMLVLGIVIVAFLILHLIQFWTKMQLAEIVGCETAIDPKNGAALLMEVFASPIALVVFIIGLAALWFHLTHGFWSAMQTLGANGKKWMCRMKAISCAWATVIVLLFGIEAVWFFAAAHCPECAAKYTNAKTYPLFEEGEKCEEACIDLCACPCDSTAAAVDSVAVVEEVAVATDSVK